MRFVLPLLLLLSSGAWAQALYTAPSTPDISVSSGSSLDVKFPGRAYVDRVYIKNDCSTPLYFNLRPDSRSATDYPLRLDDGETFTSPVGVRVATLGVSNDGASACTFTLQGFYH